MFKSIEQQDKYGPEYTRPGHTIIAFMKKNISNHTSGELQSY